MLHDAASLELLAGVAAVTHEGAGQTLNNGALQGNKEHISVLR